MRKHFNKNTNWQETSFLCPIYL